MIHKAYPVTPATLDLIEFLDYDIRVLDSQLFLVTPLGEAAKGSLDVLDNFSACLI